jgi:hypothetical protein
VRLAAFPSAGPHTQSSVTVQNKETSDSLPGSSIDIHLHFAGGRVEAVHTKWVVALVIEKRVK